VLGGIVWVFGIEDDFKPALAFLMLGAGCCNDCGGSPPAGRLRLRSPLYKVSLFFSFVKILLELTVHLIVASWIGWKSVKSVPFGKWSGVDGVSWECVGVCLCVARYKVQLLRELPSLSYTSYA
jgi:hypothetical protein